jgi:hypothetical protein
MRIVLNTALICLAALPLWPTVSYATMPLLTQTPQRPLMEACKDWAANQNPETIEIWGIEETGEYSADAGRGRLMRFCLGGPRPEIVGFGSSVEFDDAYCSHPDQRICKNRKSTDGDAKTDGQTANQADTATVNGQASDNPSNQVGPAQNVSITRVWLSLPDSCVQNMSDNWIECRDREGRPLAQFMFLVGESAAPSEAKLLTQDNLQRQFEQKSSQSEPVAEFKEKVETWLSGQKSGGGKQTGEINYDFLKSDKGVWAIYASYTYENRNGVECLIQLFEIWDDGKAIDLAINFPMSGDEIEDNANAQLVDEALKSIEISER